MEPSAESARGFRKAKDRESLGSRTSSPVLRLGIRRRRPLRKADFESENGLYLPTGQS